MPDHQHRYEAWPMGEWYCFTCRENDCGDELKCPRCGQVIFDYDFNDRTKRMEWDCWAWGGCGKDCTDFIDLHRWYMKGRKGRIEYENVPGGGQHAV